MEEIHRKKMHAKRIKILCCWDDRDHVSSFKNLANRFDKTWNDFAEDYGIDFQYFWIIGNDHLAMNISTTHLYKIQY